MAKLEILPYQRLNGIPNTEGGEKTGLTLKDMILSLLGIVLGRTVLFGVFAPLGLGFFAQNKKISLKTCMFFITSAVGTITLWDHTSAIKYITAQLIYFVFLLINDKTKPPRLIIRGVSASLALLTSGLIVSYLSGFGIFTLFEIAMEATIVFMSVILFDKLGAFIEEDNIMKRPWTKEEKITLGIMASLFVLGFNNVYINEYFSVKNFMIIFIILGISLGAGTALSTASGILLGIICNAGSPDMLAIAGIYGFCGLVSGIFARFDKIGACLGFIFANAILVVYINGSVDTMITMFEVISASVIIFLIPKAVYKTVGAALIASQPAHTGFERMKGIMESKLHAVSDSFGVLAGTFSKISEQSRTVNYNDIANMFDTAADRVCKKCDNCMICWDKEFNTTYQTMFKLLEFLEKNSSISEEDVPEYFKSRCRHLKRFTSEINSLFEVYKINCVWQNKVCESRDLVSQQLKSVSEIMDKLADDIDSEIAFDTTAENSILSRLNEKGLKSKDITVVKDRNEKYTVTMSVKNCNGAGQCGAVIKPILKSVIGKNMVQGERACGMGNENGKCALKFCESENFKISAGIAKSSAEEDSGDKYSLLNLSGGKYVAVISDGMGTGSRAASESETTVDLLKQFLESGFDKSVAVKLINSILVLKSAEDAFATIDVCIIDLYTAEVEFIKIGAAATYIKRNGKVETVRSTSLPAGIMSEIEVESFSRSLEDGDLIVMTTDGVEKKDGDDLWLRDFINNAGENLPVQPFAQQILSRAKEEFGEQPADDTTVIVLKISEKA